MIADINANIYQCNVHNEMSKYVLRILAHLVNLKPSKSWVFLNIGIPHVHDENINWQTHISIIT